MSDYYVYVYIDPRNLEEFYFGKGKGSRKDAHLTDASDSEKARRIKAIKKEGIEPIIRVIARGLSEHDAFLVEKTLLWKLGKNLTNVSSGHYALNFRPHDKLHLRLSGFDFENSLYYFNVGECSHRIWEDCAEFGFISAGQGIRWRDAIVGFEAGDIFAAYLKGHGFVGVGRITHPARPIREVTGDGVPLLSKPLRCRNMGDNAASDDLCEYVAKVDWVKSVGREDAHWVPKSGLYTTPLVRATLDNQPRTVTFLEKRFGVDFDELLQ